MLFRSLVAPLAKIKKEAQEKIALKNVCCIIIFTKRTHFCHLPRVKCHFCAYLSHCINFNTKWIPTHTYIHTQPLTRHNTTHTHMQIYWQTGAKGQGMQLQEQVQRHSMIMSVAPLEEADVLQMLSTYTRTHKYTRAHAPTHTCAHIEARFNVKVAPGMCGKLFCDITREWKMYKIFKEAFYISATGRRVLPKFQAQENWLGKNKIFKILKQFMWMQNALAI